MIDIIIINKAPITSAPCSKLKTHDVSNANRLPLRQGGRVYGMPAVKDTHSISITFQLPSLQDAYAAKVGPRVLAQLDRPPLCCPDPTNPGPAVRIYTLAAAARAFQLCALRVPLACTIVMVHARSFLSAASSIDDCRSPPFTLTCLGRVARRGQLSGFCDWMSSGGSPSGHRHCCIL